MVRKALLIVDVQNDFCPGGTLAVQSADNIIPIVNKYIRIFKKEKLPIFASRDWHPRATKHFKSHGGIWPSHCIQKTKGARFHAKLRLPKTSIVISKGDDFHKESYSVFLGINKNGTSFSRILDDLRIDELYIGGLATDYCVKESVIDALKMGIKSYLLIDAIAGVDIKKGDSKAAIRAMVACGARKIKISELSV